MKIKNHIPSLFKSFLILASALQFSCGGRNLSRDEDLTRYIYNQYYNITSVISETQENDLKVTLKVKEQLTRKSNYGEYEDVYSTNNSPRGASAKISFEDENPEFIIVDPDRDGTFMTNEAGEITFLVKPNNGLLSEYDLMGIIPSDQKISHVENNGGESIGKLKIELEKKPFFTSKSKPREPDKRFTNIFWETQYQNDLDIYNNFEYYKGEFEISHTTFHIYAMPKESTIIERQKERENARIRKQREEQRKITEVERTATNERMAIENAEREKRRLEDLINLSIAQNLGILFIEVRDAVTGNEIKGAEVSITSNAKNPYQLLKEKSFPEDKIGNYKVPNYPNSWKDDKWGNGFYCKYLNGCNFIIFKGAKHKIVIRVPGNNYEQFDDEFVPYEGKNSYVAPVKEKGVVIDVWKGIFGSPGGKLIKK